MADVVQYKLERMVKELDDLERRNLFSKLEISEIVKQRRKFEYRLKRPSPLKQDYLNYIEYEKNLDTLRILRRKAVSRELKEKGNKRMKKSVSDYSGISRIVEIYKMATNRFKGDLDIWFQFLEFCRQKRNGHLKKALAQVVRFHPKVPGVWIYAAAWEFDTNLNVASARALMHAGLRACPTSVDLWVEYIRMELTYLNKLKARKVALGEDEGTLSREHHDPADEQWRDENKELFMALNENKDDDGASDTRNGEAEKKADLFGEQGLSILQTIYSNAIKALPSDFSLRTRMLEILEATELAHSEEMKNKILDDMRRDFSKEPEYWNWLARSEAVQLQNTGGMSGDISLKKLQKAIQIYEEAVEIVPSDMMFNHYTKFLLDAIVQQNGKMDSFALANGVDCISHIIMVYEKAERMGCLTEDLACQHVTFLMELGRSDEARKLAERLCSGKFLDAVHLWDMRLSLEIRCITEKSPSLSKIDLSVVFELFKSILMRIPVSEAQSLWPMALKFFGDRRRYFDKLVEMSLGLLAKYGGSDDGFSLSSAIVKIFLQKDGIQSAREMYKRYLALPHPGLALYRSCIDLEQNLASASDKSSLVEVQRLYESALATYDQDVSLWQDYHNIEIKMGTSEAAAAVHWRARKTLKENAALLTSESLS